MFADQNVDGVRLLMVVTMTGDRLPTIVRVRGMGVRTSFALPMIAVPMRMMVVSGWQQPTAQHIGDQGDVRGVASHDSLLAEFGRLLRQRRIQARINGCPGVVENDPPNRPRTALPGGFRTAHFECRTPRVGSQFGS